MVTMLAEVIRVECCRLVVCDECTKQEVVVNARNAACFCPGERICIHYSGVMAMSMPPQITACRIVRMPCHER